MSAIEEIVEELWSLEIEDLPDDVIKEAAKALFDNISLSILGYERSEKAKRFASLAYPTENGSIVCGGWWRTSPSMAALVNAFSSHVLEFDDWLEEGLVHAGSAVVPSILSVGEGRISWEEAILSTVIGYEIAARFGKALREKHNFRWHITALAGSLGAAAASSKALGLDLRKVVSSLSIAAYYASGLLNSPPENLDIEPFSPAYASFLGVTSTLMAGLGFRGGIVPGESFVYDNEALYDLEIVKRPDWDYAVLLNGYRLYPCCRYAYSAIIAALALSSEVDTIEEVEIRTFNDAIEVAGIEVPTSLEEALFSLKFLVATSLLYGSFGLDIIERALNDPRVRNIEHKVKVFVDMELSSRFPSKQPALVRVKSNGKWLEREVDIPPGNPSSPVELEDLLNKVLPHLRGGTDVVVLNLYKQLKAGDFNRILSVV